MLVIYLTDTKHNIMKAKYRLIRQSDGKELKVNSLQVIANFLGGNTAFIKLHLDKEVQLKGWEIKSL